MLPQPLKRLRPDCGANKNAMQQTFHHIGYDDLPGFFNPPAIDYVKLWWSSSGKAPSLIILLYHSWRLCSLSVYLSLT